MTSVPACQYCGRLGGSVSMAGNLAVGSVYACRRCIDGGDPLEGMTSDRWQRIPQQVRAVIRDSSDLSPQLIGYEGWRVYVVRMDGTPARFIVGRSTGWKPCHLEIKRIDSTGGGPADKAYKEVTPIARIR